jgi:NTP pyrophosphatase (non-canonical NTP hydrolase)
MNDELELAVNAASGEAERAQEKYGDFASMHEAYGVLAEEVAELFDAVRMGQAHPSRSARIEAEAEQVAAVALRIRAQAHRVTR